MKILFLSHYFPPEVNAPASRVYEHCKSWVASGHEVTVVTCAPNHPYGKVYDDYKNKRTSENVDGINVIRLKTYISENKGFFKRTLGYVSYMLAVTFASRTFGKYDIVVSTSPQFFNGLAGYFVSRFKRIPWVLEIRDLWPDSILAVGAINNKYIIRTLYKLESFCYRKSDKIIAVTDSFRQYMIAKGITQDKIAVIKNGVDLSAFDSRLRSSDQEFKDLLPELDRESLAKKFVVSYVGTHGMAHGLETLLKAADLLREESTIHFLMVGDGAEKEALFKLKSKLKLPNVTMIKQKPKKAMPLIWSVTDLSLVHLKKQDLFKTVIPSKIFEALAMRKPILLGVEGESALLIKQAEAGVTIEPENVEQMARAIKYLSINSAACEAMAANGQEYVINQFDRKKLAQVYETTLLNVVQNGLAIHPAYSKYASDANQ